MMNILRIRNILFSCLAVLILGILLIGCTLTGSDLSEGPQVLFIGNSYTDSNGFPEMFANLARSGGHDVEVGLLARGGWTLEKHAQAAETAEIIQQRAWDYVVLQEQSIIPSNTVVREQSMYPAVRILNNEIENIGASAILFITWGRRDGLSQLGYSSFSEMQNGLSRGYLNIAIELNILVSPVGLAWKNALKIDPQLALWQDDGSHPSVLGSYLAACVFYAVIFNESPEGLPFMAGLPEDIGRLLQAIAAETVFL